MKTKLLLLTLMAALLTLTGCASAFGADECSDADAYQKAHYLDTYGGDLNSNLSVFPDAVADDMDVLCFRSRLTTGLFDTDGYILLDYQLPEAAFEAELARLETLRMDIHAPSGAVWTNQVRLDLESYAYPAYVTIDGFDSTYEYALIDRAACRIICVYLAGPQSGDFPYDTYLKTDPRAYDAQDALSAYSMYNHSFDGGESYTEFDD